MIHLYRRRATLPTTRLLGQHLRPDALPLAVVAALPRAWPVVAPAGWGVGWAIGTAG
ncbi:hypothetical protein [Nitrolancea hollandica]|uniref:Uncharacterized protein n=1 Tax=Nitrolancea hollandica Lb TaxID=1129897 RepID=I4EG24_9BACT|nr:hypothetical protein [Nitrolancea hollandica]CCF83636.1 hypothetical protein NITHO_2520011 [Nitrolancea hollandica Lb]